MQKFAEELLLKKANLKWSAVSRVSLFQPEQEKQNMELLHLCKKAGALRITVGIESGNQQMLDAMNKKTTIVEIEYAIELIRRAGIKATGSMLVGYPGETVQTVKDSISFANRNLLQTSFYCLIPLPGTALYDECKAKGIIKHEDEYLETISEHGDASHIYINLTDMTDKEYVDIVEVANIAVSTIPTKAYFDYYGTRGGVVALLKQYAKSINTKLHKRVFETP